ncbi:MAG: ceramidase [Gemmataceae bacterium]|nr:ceramidase [Gemmataceae bacterium]
MPDRVEGPPSAGPDIGLVNPTPPAAGEGRLTDWGPRYTETPVDPTGPGAPTVAEPWNTVTAALFVVIVAAWAWRLRGRYRDYPFLCACMPILLAGGVGGVLYHATRASPVYFLLDVIPISLLGLAGAIYLLIKLGQGTGWRRVVVSSLGALAFYAAVNVVLFAGFRGVVERVPNLRVNLSYASLAVLILAPMAVVLVRTRFRHGGWVVAGLVSFVIAWFFRLVDRDVGPYVPMGSHWLWHTFGAITTALVIEYFYLVEGEREPTEPASEPDPEW